MTDTEILDWLERNLYDYEVYSNPSGRMVSIWIAGGQMGAMDRTIRGAVESLVGLCARERGTEQMDAAMSAMEG